MFIEGFIKAMHIVPNWVSYAFGYTCGVLVIIYLVIIALVFIASLIEHLFS